MTGSGNNLQYQSDSPGLDEFPKPPRRFYLGHSRQNSSLSPKQDSDIAPPAIQPKSPRRAELSAAVEKPTASSPSPLTKLEKSEGQGETTPSKVARSSTPPQLQSSPIVTTDTEEPSTPTPTPTRGRRASRIPKYSLSPKALDISRKINKEPHISSVHIETNSPSHLSSQEREHEVYNPNLGDFISPVDMSSIEKPKIEQDVPNEESFIHVSDAPTYQLKAPDGDVASHEEKKANGRHTSNLSQSSDKTLADDHHEADTHSSEAQTDVSFADALKGYPSGENGTGSQIEDDHGSEIRTDDSYPELDEMTMDEVHHIPVQSVTSSYGKIRWAPWDVPAKRRLQTLMVLMHCLSIIGLVSIFFAFCANPFAWPLLIIYLMHVLGSKVATDGSLSYRVEWFRGSPIWHLFAGYFPAKLHKTHDLQPTRKYIFGYHPHGIISHGAWAAFATDALGFSKKFPGITNSLLTLDSNFRIPFYRDYILGMGVRSVSKESIVNILTRGGPNNEGMGRAVTIVVGGARESLEAQPGNLRLILKDRKGFIKIAVRTGADLVPVLAFGENDLYDQLRSKEHPFVHRIQIFLLKVWKFTLPFMHGRGIFNYDVGMMPYRHPLNIVVGAPIKVQQSNHVDNEEIDRLHDLYVTELQKLWNRYKDEFAKDRKEEMQILH